MTNEIDAMIGLQRIEVEGKRFVLLPETEYDRLRRGAGETAADDERLPPLPKPDKHGRFPALQICMHLLGPRSGQVAASR